MIMHDLRCSPRPAVPRAVPPLVRGGQGRNADDVCAAARGILLAMLISAPLWGVLWLVCHLAGGR